MHTKYGRTAAAFLERGPGEEKLVKAASRRALGDLKVAPTKSFSAKPLISTHLTRDRCKPFISKHIVTRGAVGRRGV